MKTTHSLYNNTVTIDFDSDAKANRYIVTDTVKGITRQPVPGVTSVIDKALHKPGLLTFPLNAALSHLGATFDVKQGKWVLETEITLTSELVGSASKAWLDRSNAGKDVGTEAHSLIEQFLLGASNLDSDEALAGYPDASPEARKAFKAFTNWYKEHVKIKPLAIEQIVYSRAHAFAGTFDCLLEIDGKTVLCDLKTTNVSRYGLKVDGKWTGIYPENFLQLGAYAQAYREEHFHNTGKLESPISDLMVINVTKDGNIHTLKASELGLKVEDCEQAFLQARDLLSFLSRVRKGDIDE